MNDPVFLGFAAVEEIHNASLELYGGMPGIREKHLIESALGAALDTFQYAQGDLFDIAAAYAYHISQAQAFIDGNKRTAVGAAYLFLRANGITTRPADDEIYDAMIAVAEHRLGKPGLADIFRRAANSAS